MLMAIRLVSKVVVYILKITMTKNKTFIMFVTRNKRIKSKVNDNHDDDGNGS